MAWAKKISAAGKAARLAIVASALVGGIAAAPAAASATTTKTESSDSVQASFNCSYSLTYYRADAYCNVYSGSIRLRSYCSGYGYIASPWVGPGSWHLWTDCGSYQRTGSWIDYTG
jgi:hypothetical protein